MSEDITRPRNIQNLLKLMDVSHDRQEEGMRINSTYGPEGQFIGMGIGLEERALFFHEEHRVVVSVKIVEAP